MAEGIVSAEDIRAAFHYSPESGLMTRLVGTSSRAKLGDVVGSKVSSGHLRVRVKSAPFLVHRLAWLYMTGEWPRGEIDHINGDPTDNRWLNLRDVCHRTNAENIRSAQRRTKSGFLGVHIQRRNTVRYLAQIVTGGKLRHIGCFDTPEEAHAAYLEVKRSIHEGCTI